MTVRINSVLFALTMGTENNKLLLLSKEGSAEPKNGLNERNVSLLTDCSASETFFDEVKALHCFQRK